MATAAGIGERGSGKRRVIGLMCLGGVQRVPCVAIREAWVPAERMAGRLARRLALCGTHLKRSSGTPSAQL